MEFPIAIAVFFVAHWVLSVFFQTFFLHRYAAHKMFTVSPRMEKFFYLCTYLTQGSSFLNPRAYAILHRMHHAYSDTPKDPHSPIQNPNVFKMMWHTKDIYVGVKNGTYPVEERFEGDVPSWPALERISNTWASPIAWGVGYTLFYVAFATSPWLFLLLPIHFLMGPIHGAIVNWCGHKYGYRNFDSTDDSKNTLVFDFLTLGELFQNNHHKYGMRPNFGVRWFEIDPAWQVIRVLDKVGLIELKGKHTLRHGVEKPRAPAPVATPGVEPALESATTPAFQHAKALPAPRVVAAAAAAAAASIANMAASQPPA